MSFDMSRFRLRLR